MSFQFGLLRYYVLNIHIVLIRVTASLLLNTYAKPVVNAVQPIISFVAMFCDLLCIGSPLAINKSRILSSEGLLLLLSVVVFHLATFALGYWASKPFLREMSFQFGLLRYYVLNIHVVLVPVTAGLLLNTYAKPVVNDVQPIISFVAMFCDLLCIGSPLAINKSHILSSEGLLLLLSVVVFHLATFALGYWASKPFLRNI
ncbi:hypothetical protein KSP39_PZI007877 [Platanthera zijinensis]|uniref:Uncharacterized protein n=1 Tax=Platanthera zijinensis TaxID=2320716 RepID=A0AAP0G8F0_9ASPA